MTQEQSAPEGMPAALNQTAPRQSGEAPPEAAPPEAPAKTQAVRRLFTGRTELALGVAEVIGMARRTIRIFDSTTVDLALSSRASEEMLRAFFLAGRMNRMQIAVHETTHIQYYSPRLMSLLKRFSHAIAIHQTHEPIRNLPDVMVIADDQHFLRKPHGLQPGGVINLYDPADTQLWLDRFADLWEQSSPAVSATTLGL